MHHEIFCLVRFLNYPFSLTHRIYYNHDKYAILLEIAEEMTTEVKIIIGVSIATIIIIIGGVLFASKSANEPKLSTETVDQNLLMKEDSNMIISNGATVTLVEFGDFQCPACGVAHPYVKQILGKYDGKVNFVFRNFPLQGHQNAMVAAEAAEAAGEQGKYWEMHDTLFETQGEWGGDVPLNNKDAVEKFVSYAKALGLDTEKFKQAMENNKFEKKVKQDQKDGYSLGVKGTPTFFLNGKQFTGSAAELSQEIDSLLSSSK